MLTPLLAILWISWLQTLLNDSVFWGLHTSTGSVLVNRSIPLAVAGVKPGSQLEVLGRLLGGTKKPVSLPSGMLLVWEWVMPQSVFRR